MWYMGSHCLSKAVQYEGLLEAFLQLAKVISGGVLTSRTQVEEAGSLVSGVDV